jgi:hypothetical protein
MPAVGVDDRLVYSARTRQGVLSDRSNVRATTVPTSGSARATVSRFECGYVDLEQRGVAPIQSGCAIHYDGRNEDSAWAKVEYVPAGEQTGRRQMAFGVVGS